MIFIADLIACSTCFGHHYAHHQELESIIQVAAACGIWCFGFQVVGMVWSWRLCVQFAGCCSLMMGVMVPETCWASNKICNKNHLLHLDGILFPHINDDARSKSHQIDTTFTFKMTPSLFTTYSFQENIYTEQVYGLGKNSCSVMQVTAV